AVRPRSRPYRAPGRSPPHARPRRSARPFRPPLPRVSALAGPTLVEFGGPPQQLEDYSQCNGDPGAPPSLTHAGPPRYARETGVSTPLPRIETIRHAARQI